MPEVPTEGFDPSSTRSAALGAALGVRVQHDTRDNQFYPFHGSFFDVKADFFDAALGSKDVVAYRGAVCSVAGDVPFYDLCLLGNSEDIRGYAVGQYQDRLMIVGQVEYRRELFWRIGAVAYFGAGEVADTFSDFDTDGILPGGGVGLRFTLAEQDHINLRIDFA